MSLAHDLKQSREHEMRTYLNSMKSMYENSLDQNGEIFDIARAATNDFCNITPEAIMEDSRIIKILRYSVAPSISQMKFGQLFGLTSIDSFENDRLEAGLRKYQALSKIAPKIAEFVEQNLDAARFIWVVGSTEEIFDRSLAIKYAKGWTCSIAADQNAQTRYRNWRKDLQEQAITSMLIEMGYVKSSFRGIARKDSDINIGEFTQELKVQGRTRQKADLIARSKKSGKLILIEAKVVGVEIDSTKRIKECCDKANDWKASRDLRDPLVVAVISGFFNETGIDSLLASGILVFWEHRLSDLSEVL